MKIITKILGLFSVIGGIISTIFYVLFKQKKEENKQLQEDIKRSENKIDEQQKIIDFTEEFENQKQEIKNKHKEEFEKVSNDNKLDNFNAMVDILQK